MSLDQQILAELQKLNRRMDKLNPALSEANVTRLFGNPEGDPTSRGRLPATKGASWSWSGA
jgi:hypothetical protein